MAQTILCVEQGAPLSVYYVEAERLQETLIDDRTLAVIRFGSETQIDGKHPHLFTVGLPEVSEQQTLEVWRSSYPVQRERKGDIHWSSNETIGIACVLIKEDCYGGLEAATCRAYKHLLKFIQGQGYPFVIRVWNYFPDINDFTNGLERYQGFCRGRYQALADNGVALETSLPAACAIGTHSPGLLVYCLVAKSPGLQIENPRQMSAFHYPLCYSPKSPSFSRAILKHWTETESHLYVSGTASIVGHKSRHQDNVLAQLLETMSNLDELVNAANNHCEGLPLRPALLKLYGRSQIAQDELQSYIAEHFGSHTSTLFLQGDICRCDLLLEIEGLWVTRMYENPYV
jgi:chorismate lyase/3-hydroxybenzoate synthase